MVFSKYHPAVNFMFYIAALVMAMCFTHPAFLIGGFVSSLAYYAVVKGNPGKYLAGMAGILIALSVINPLFSTYGETVLFIYMGGRCYTLESFCYGLSLAAMFVTVITWFATYQAIMSSDKFLYCFGKLAPSVTLILTMIFRLVPDFQGKISKISGARRCIGMSAENGSTKEKAQHGLLIVSSLTSWALEGGIVMADSMKSRGFGTGKRSFFSVYRMERRDRILFFVMTGLLVVIGICFLKGGMKASYSPRVSLAGWRNPWMLLGLGGYISFLAIPTVLEIWEVLTWHILRSKI